MKESSLPADNLNRTVDLAEARSRHNLGARRFAVACLVLSLGLAASVVLRLIRPGIMQVPRGKRFLTAVMLYGATLTMMLLSALITLFRPEWQVSHALLAAVGASLFFTSDSILAYDRFVRKLKHGQSYVHLTYHVGQMCLVAGAMLHFLSLT